MYSTDAFNQNPANIQRQRHSFDTRFNFNLFTTGGYMWHSEYFNLDFYNRYFTNNKGKVLSDTEKNDIIETAYGKQTSFMLTWNLLSFVYNSKKAGSFGISIDERIWGNFLANRDLMEVLLFGNQKMRTYDYTGSEFAIVYTRQINLSYANRIKSPDRNKYGDIYYGFSLKPQFGLYYSALEDNNYSLYTDDTNRLYPNGSAELYYSGLVTSAKDKFRAGPRPAGFGLAADLGIGMKFKDFLGIGTFDFGLSVIDLGFITWTDNAGKYEYTGGYVIRDITSEGGIDSLEAILQGFKVDDRFTKMMPLVIKFGFNYRLCLKDKNRRQPPPPEEKRLELINFSMEYIQGITKSSGGNTNPMLAIGTEVNIGKYVSPRLGLTWGGRERFSLSAGIGFDFGPVSVDVGTYNIQSLYNPNSSTKLSGGVAVKYRIK